MPSQAHLTGLTYDDLTAFPDDLLRRELIDGELVVSPSPTAPHQDVVVDIVVEVSSPSTRRTDLVRKLALYERFGIPEYWYADLDNDTIRVYRLHNGAYGNPIILKRGDILTSPLLPGFAVPVAYLLGR
ncbi:MAG: Uma2 family endonuclease [Egibacteraceae bacterium]